MDQNLVLALRCSRERGLPIGSDLPADCRTVAEVPRRNRSPNRVRAAGSGGAAGGRLDGGLRGMAVPLPKPCRGRREDPERKLRRLRRRFARVTARLERRDRLRRMGLGSRRWGGRSWWSG
jgi:hypothetical protein